MLVDILFITLYIFAGSILTAMIFHLWFNRKILNIGSIIFVLISAWIWVTSQTGGYIFPSFNHKLFFNFIQYIGIVTLPVAWLVFCLDFINPKKMIKLGFVLGLSIIPIFFLILLFTNHYHSIMWIDITISANGITLVKQNAIGLYLLIAYSYILLLTGFIILIVTGFFIRPHLRKRVVLICLVALPLLLINIIDLFIGEKIFYFELTPISLALVSLVVIYLIRLRYYRTIPLTQHAVIESMKDMVIILSPENQIIYVNPNAYKLFIITSAEIAAKHVSTFFLSLLRIVESTDLSELKSKEIKLLDKTYDASISLIYNWRKRIISKVLVLRDISRLKKIEENLRQIKEHLEVRVQDRTNELKKAIEALKTEVVERKKAEEIVRASLAEKEILLSELHHRVKNNLQIISSILKLQSYHIKEKKAMEILNTAISRIKSIAMIHEKLYKSNEFANTNLKEYIHDLTKYIIYSFQTETSNILITINIETIYLDLDRSILCGLIINELLTNAIKYAFPRKKKGRKSQEIKIEFIEVNKCYILKVSDNGVGLPPNFDIYNVNSLGMKIITALTKQLKGTIELNTNNGTTVTVKF